MKFGKNVVTDTRYTDGYFKVIIQKYNKTVQGVVINTPEDDVIEMKSINKLKDLADLLDGVLKDWESDGKE